MCKYKKSTSVECETDLRAAKLNSSLDKEAAVWGIYHSDTTTVGLNPTQDTDVSSRVFCGPV